MAKLSCKLISHSVSTHLRQIYTGFFMLYKMGIVSLDQLILKKRIKYHSKIRQLSDVKHAHLHVKLNHNINLHYDTHDSCEIDEEYLDESDYYFKRSYSPQYIQHMGEKGKKIYPLGLNYPIYPTDLDWFSIRRDVSLSKGIKKLDTLRSLKIINRLIFTPNIDNMWSVPDYESAPKVLFMVRAWDPNDNPGRPQERVDERMHINDVRAQCIKMLRNEFGGSFYGGFAHTDFAVKNYKEFLMPNNNLSSKKNYISLLKSYPICVATTGLYGSIGFKFAEYIAFAKAILSEKLNYEVPGNLMKDKNYLEFNTPDECVRCVQQLFSNEELRSFMMENNARYYHLYLRPDALILNTLLLAISGSKSSNRCDAPAYILQ